MVAERPADDGALVQRLGDHDRSDEDGAEPRVVARPVLRPAQEDVARHRPLDPGHEAAVLGEVGDGDAVPAAVREEAPYRPSATLAPAVAWSTPIRASCRRRWNFSLALPRSWRGPNARAMSAAPKGSAKRAAVSATSFRQSSSGSQAFSGPSLVWAWSVGRQAPKGGGAAEGFSLTARLAALPRAGQGVVGRAPRRGAGPKA